MMMNSKNVKKLLGLSFVAAACSVATGCAASFEVAEEQGADGEGTVGTTSQALIFSSVITVANGTTSTTGVLVAPDTALIVSSAFPTSQNPTQLTTRSFVGSSVGNGRDLVRHTSQRVALVKLSASSSRAVSFNTAPMSQMVGRTIECSGVNAQGASVRRRLVAQSASGNELFVDVPPAVGFTPADPPVTFGEIGLACLDPNGHGGLLGILVGTRTVLSVRAFMDWFPGAQNLFTVRATGARPMSLYYLRNQSDWASKNCLDIPWGTVEDHAPVNQFPCNFALSQRFYLDYSRDPNAPALVSASSGLCVDIPNESSVSGTPLQQTRCNGQRNQKWTQRIFNPAGTSGSAGWGWVSGQPTNLCLTGSRTNNFGQSLPTSTSTCQSGTTANTEQRWFIQWN